MRSKNSTGDDCSLCVRARLNVRLGSLAPGQALDRGRPGGRCSSEPGGGPLGLLGESGGNLLSPADGAWELVIGAFAAFYLSWDRRWQPRGLRRKWGALIGLLLHAARWFSSTRKRRFQVCMHWSRPDPPHATPCAITLPTLYPAPLTKRRFYALPAQTSQRKNGYREAHQLESSPALQASMPRERKKGLVPELGAVADHADADCQVVTSLRSAEKDVRAVPMAFIGAGGPFHQWLPVALRGTTGTWQQRTCTRLDKVWKTLPTNCR